MARNAIFDNGQLIYALEESAVCGLLGAPAHAALEAGTRPKIRA